MTSAPDQAAADRAQALRVGVLMSVVMYAALMGASLGGDVRATWIQAFGRRPLGLPTPLFVGGLLTILYLPVPITFYHFVMVSEQARRDGAGFFGLGAILYLADVHHRHPHLTRSRRICLGSLGYFIAIAAAWIVYTASLGI